MADKSNKEKKDTIKKVLKGNKGLLGKAFKGASRRTQRQKKFLDSL